MQFREQGKKIQLISYRGYINKTQAAELGVPAGAQVKFVGSLDKLTLELELATDKATGKPFELTEKEREELDGYLKAQRSERDQKRYKSDLSGAVWSLTQATKALEAGHSFDLTYAKPEAVWTAMIALEKALAAAGHPRPKRHYKRSKAVDTATQTLPGVAA